MSTNNLPIQVTSFVGRERELRELAQLLPATRLLTLTGAGGTGKTRLALQLASDLLDQFKDGVWFIDLAPLSDPALVPIALATVLGVREEQSRELTATLVEWLRDKQLLFILDNCEHLLDACAGVADAVLHGGRGTLILATSREALGIAGERAWRVPSLPGPRPSDLAGADAAAAQPGQSPLLQGSAAPAVALQDYASVRLFVERATFANAAFRMTDANASHVAQICYRLDGIPLAIELAAARAKTMRVEQIAERLDDRFRLLTGGSRTALPRQQTLRGTMDWSYGLLTEPERTLLRRLSVFAGGWTLEAAEAVCGDTAGSDVRPPVAVTAILETLGHLVERSLVGLDEQAAEPRYHMLETIRQYAHEKLLAAGEGDRMGELHLAFFHGLADRAEAPAESAQRGKWLQRLELEHDNLRAALEWACARDREGARLLAGRLGNFWGSADDHLNEALTWYGRVLGPGEPTLRTRGMALALRGAGWISAYLLFLDDAHAFLEPSVSIWRELNDKVELAQALFKLCYVKIHRGDSEGACAIFEANEALFREFADAATLAWALSWWARALAVARADFGGAKLLHEQSMIISQKIGFSGAISHLGYLATQQGDYALARQYMEESLARQRHATPASCGVGLGQVADVAYLQGDYSESRALNEEALASFRAVGDRAHVAHIATGLGYVAIRLDELEKAEAILSEGLAILYAGQFELGTARCLAGYADLRLAQGRAEEAVRLLAAEVVRSHSHTSHIPIDRIRYERTLAAARAALDEAAFGAAWDAGRSLTLEQAIAGAEQGKAAPRKASNVHAAPRDPNALTVREREVLRLVATGLSDAQIAAQLVISRRTVQTHLTTIFGKFGVNSRSAAAHYAASHKLL